MAGDLEETFQAQPGFAVRAGRHELDGRLPDWSADGIEREITRLRAAQAEDQAVDAASLSGPQRFEREALLSEIDGSLF